MLCLHGYRRGLPGRLRFPQRALPRILQVVLHGSGGGCLVWLQLDVIDILPVICMNMHVLNAIWITKQICAEGCASSEHCPTLHLHLEM